jgi:hypothetical protein
MTPDQYLLNIIRLRSRTPLQINDYRLSNINLLIKNWAGSYLREIKLSGSSAKNVVVSGEADTDMFISLKNETPQDLKTIFDSLATTLQQNQYPVSKRTVAIQTSTNGQKIDLVPGKQQAGYQNWHSLYNSDTGNWLQTNIDGHINSVINSGRRDEIRAIKIWTNNHQLKFPSIYLELIVFEALYNKNKNQLAINIRSIFEYLRDKFVDKRIEDPSNSNNILSEYLLKKYQKEAIANKAGESLAAQYWEQVIW